MSTLISTDLFEKALVEPLVDDKANKLCIVSGYATATMAIRHIEYAKRKRKDLAIELIVGMCPQDGIERKNHNAFVDLHASAGLDFKCFYVVNRPPIHSKVYTWLNNNRPVLGYVGSANYTQNAFSRSMREVLCEESARACLEYFNHVRGEAQACNTRDIPDLIEIFDRKITTRTGATEIISESETAISASSVSTGLENVTLTLLDSSTGETPLRSGLNWGQRPGRNKNQAYINIPADTGRSGFFPDRSIVFTVVTDDGKELICVRAQANGKGIETPLNNSQMGEYFRYRLGLASGAFVTKDDLLRYGRTDVTFYKIDEENYYMDFSVS